MRTRDLQFCKKVVRAWMVVVGGAVLLAFALAAFLPKVQGAENYSMTEKRDISKMEKPQGVEAMVFKTLLEAEGNKWIPPHFARGMKLSEIGIQGRTPCPGKGTYIYVVAYLEWAGDCYECLACFFREGRTPIGDENEADLYILTGALQTNVWKSI